MSLVILQIYSLKCRLLPFRQKNLRFRWVKHKHKYWLAHTAADNAKSVFGAVVETVGTI